MFDSILAEAALADRRRELDAAERLAPHDAARHAVAKWRLLRRSRGVDTVVHKVDEHHARRAVAVDAALLPITADLS